MPVKGRVTISSDYGEDRGSYLHRGIDFDGKMGDSIYSAAGGKVIYSGYTESGGNEVVIQHSNNLMTRYAHLNEIIVKESQFIEDAEKIGAMGNTGTVYSANGGDGSHLHFEVIENGQRVDPDKYLKLKQVNYQVGDYVSTYGSSSTTFDITDSNFDQVLPTIGKAFSEFYNALKNADYKEIVSKILEAVINLQKHLNLRILKNHLRQ